MSAREQTNASRRDLETLASTLRRAYPIDQQPCFADLLAEIDAAAREASRDVDDEPIRSPTD